MKIRIVPNDDDFGRNFPGDKRWFYEHFGNRYEPGRSAVCPTCAHEHMLYRRTLNAGMARRLIALYREAGLMYQFVSSTSVREESKLAWWGLLDKQPGNQRGWWKVSTLGEQWLRGDVTVPKWAVVLDNRLLRIEGKRITVSEALREPFDFDRLMRGE